MDKSRKTIKTIPEKGIIPIFVPKVSNLIYMNKKTLLFFFLALMISPIAALSQTITVSGKVISSDDGYGLPGVTIQVKGTVTGTVTDLDGNYSLKADSQDVLVFSFVGYKTKEIAVKGKTKINVTLEVDSQTLDDVYRVHYI